jgi:hypothetical protein
VIFVSHPNEDDLDLSGDTVKQTLDKLIEGNRVLSPKLKRCIEDLGPIVVPALIDIMKDTSLLNEDSRGEGYIPSVAARALAEMNKTEALGPMIDILAQIDSLSPTSSEFEESIALLGKSSIDSILERYAVEKSQDLKRRLTDVLARSGVKDRRIYHIFIDQLKSGHGSAPQYLADFGNPDAITFLQDELDKVHVSENPFENLQITELDSALTELGARLTFKQRLKVKKTKAVSEQLFGSLLGAGARGVGKIGRNDPCHCGSGEKYKKCCLKLN